MKNIYAFFVFTLCIHNNNYSSQQQMLMVQPNNAAHATVVIEEEEGNVTDYRELRATKSQPVAPAQKQKKGIRSCCSLLTCCLERSQKNSVKK